MTSWARCMLLLAAVLLVVPVSAQSQTDRRRVRDTSAGTSTDDETAEQREARQDKGLEEPEKKGLAPGLAPGPETVGKTEEGNWGKLTPEQQKAAVDELKKFAEDTKAQVDGNLVLNETKYFLFYSDLKPADAAKWTAVLDRLYMQLANLFGIKGGQNIFRGKALVFVFAKREDYVNFQKTMHHTDAGQTLGMCHQHGNGDVHIAFFRQASDPDFEAVFVHETVHGFLHRYRKPPKIPSWANEGFAEWIANKFVDQRGKRQELRNDAITRLRQRGALGDEFFTADHIEPWQYPVAQLLTDFMINANRSGYVGFIDGIKDGMKPQDALTQKFGLTPDQLAEAFGNELRIRGLGASKPLQDARRPESGRDQDQREVEKEQQQEGNANSRNRNRSGL